jgi:hypothetical protein
LILFGIFLSLSNNLFVLLFEQILAKYYISRGEFFELLTLFFALYYVPIQFQNGTQRTGLVAGGGFETRPPKRPPI